MTYLEQYAPTLKPGFYTFRGQRVRLSHASPVHTGVVRIFFSVGRKVHTARLGEFIRDAVPAQDTGATP